MFSLQHAPAEQSLVLTGTPWQYPEQMKGSCVLQMCELGRRQATYRPQKQRCRVPDSSLSRPRIPLNASATHCYDNLDPMSIKIEDVHRVLHRQVHPEAALHAFPRAHLLLQLP